MYNTYTSSALLSLGTNGSVSFSFNDCSNLFNERFGVNPLLSSSSKCCSCCRSSSCCSCCCASSSSSSFATHRVPITPSLFYGLRQSTLLQLSPSRRLILGGRDRYCYRVPAYGLDHGCYEVSCYFKEKSGSEGFERRRRRSVGQRRFHERRCFSSVNDVEAVISLLSEDVSDEYLGDRKRNVNFVKKVEFERRGDYGGECHKGRRKNVGMGQPESNSKCELASETVELRKERHERKEDRQKREEREEKKEKEESKAVSRHENCRHRKASSSFSSYYSLSSTGDFASDEEEEDKYDNFLDESSDVYRRKSRNEEGKFDRQVVEGHQKHKDHAEEQVKTLEQRTSATRKGVDWDLRKKSEKRLTEIEETQSRQKSSEMHCRTSTSHESDYRKASSSHKEIDHDTEKVNWDRRMREQCGKMSNQVKEQSDFRRNNQEITATQDFHNRNVDMTSEFEKHLIGKEENLITEGDSVQEISDGHHKVVGKSVGNENLRGKTQHLTVTSEVGHTEGTYLHRQSESGMKMQKEDRTSSSAWGTNKQHHQMGGQITERTEPRSSQQHSEISENYDRSSEKMSILQSETRMKKQRERTSVASSSGTETKEPTSHADEKVLQKIQSKQVSQDVTNISVNVTNVSMVHASNTTKVTNSQTTTEKRIIDQEHNSASVVTPNRETTESKIENDKSVARDKSRNGGKPYETSGSQASMDVVSQGRVQQINVEEGYQRSSNIMMMPPSIQLVDRGNLNVGLSGGIAIHEVSQETSESGSSSMYMNSGQGIPAFHQEPCGRDGKGEMCEEPLSLFSPEDSMGSAHRLEESSMQFVGEFVDKARHEVLTSNFQKERTASDANLVDEGEQHRQNSSGQFGSEDLQLKEQHSRRSSGGSGVKGPSDEMWDEKDAYLPESPETEAPKGTQAVVKRSGRSLWNIIANIVRLHWGSWPETPKSATRSHEKISSTDSASSETWFSGHEADENSDEKMKREKRSMTKKAASSPKLQVRQTSGQAQGEASKAIESKDIIRQVEAEESRSTWKGIASPSEEGFASSSMEVRESSFLPLPSSGMSSHFVEESSVAIKTDASGSVEAMEQPPSAKSTEVSTFEGKDADLRRRSLQRNMQVMRDRFDEWEEAHNRETEQRKIDEMFMREALLEAKKAADNWEVPVGAVLVQHGKIIARGCNLVEELRDSTAHAEMICIREASSQLRSWRLAETTLYVTLEPCPMCAGAILQARIHTLVWGAPNKLLGADGSWIRLFPNGEAGESGSEVTDKPAPPVHPFHPNMKVRRGILASECADVMQQFFQLRRRKKEKNGDSPPGPSCLPIVNRQSKFLHKMHNIFHAMYCL